MYVFPVDAIGPKTVTYGQGVNAEWRDVCRRFLKSSGLDLLCVCLSSLQNRMLQLKSENLSIMDKKWEQLEDQRTYINVFLLVVPSDLCSSGLVMDAANDS